MYKIDERGTNIFMAEEDAEVVYTDNHIRRTRTTRHHIHIIRIRILRDGSQAAKAINPVQHFMCREDQRLQR